MTQIRSVCCVEGCQDLVHCINAVTNEMGVVKIYWRDKCWFHHTQTFKDAYIKKTYCENIDGRLGFVCDATIRWRGQLQVDHIDGNPMNNDPKNKQTLCGLCHPIKTRDFKDGRSSGRKRLTDLGKYHDEIKALQVMARDMGTQVTLRFNERKIFDQVNIDGYGLREPADAAAILRYLTKGYVWAETAAN